MPSNLACPIQETGQYLRKKLGVRRLEKSKADSFFPVVINLVAIPLSFVNGMDPASAVFFMVSCLSFFFIKRLGNGVDGNTPGEDELGYQWMYVWTFSLEREMGGEDAALLASVDSLIGLHPRVLSDSSMYLKAKFHWIVLLGKLKRQLNTRFSVLAF